VDNPSAAALVYRIRDNLFIAFSPFIFIKRVRDQLSGNLYPPCARPGPFLSLNVRDPPRDTV
jgi:hypothetical protein